MANEGKVAAQVAGTGYSIIKDAIVYLKSKAKYVARLEHNLSKMIEQLVTFYSRKDEIDEYLKRAVSKEGSAEYEILNNQVGVFHERCCKFISKYRGYWNDLPGFDIQNVSTAADMIAALGKRKPTIKTLSFFQLAKLSRRINELSNDISEINGKLTVRENMFREKKIEPVRVIPNDIIRLPSSTKYVTEIMECLRANGNNYIGVLGPIGVGKTFILKDLNNQLGRLSGTPKKIEFNIVIWIDCDKKHDARGKATELIQDVIMGRLGLEQKKENSVGDNAHIISSFLRDKKYILLIDQFSPEIKLEEVGIHKDQRLGKVVIASSNKKLITTLTDQQVQIQQLSEDDALNFFYQIRGPISDSRIIPTAKSIVKSCGGLQLVIKLVAFHLRSANDENAWSDVKSALQSDTKYELQDLADVGKAYELVYEKLKKYQKKCLLFMTLFPSGQQIYKDYLVECWNAESFLELDDPQLRSARDRGATTLRDLTDQYLLENLSDKHVKMPAYFRKVASAKEYPDENGFRSWVPKENQHLTEETLRNTKRLSLMCYKFQLPNNPDCDNISTLLMQRNSDLLSVKATFFCNMRNLCILDLHGTRIASLPHSISSLVSLKSLYLNDCPLLAKLPKDVKKLKKLELLDIRGTSIKSLANEVTDLRCLRISFGKIRCNRYRTCEEEEMMIDMIIRLHQLEELTIEAGCCSQGWKDIVDRVAQELAGLTMLNTLNFHFPKVSTLRKFVVESKSLNNTSTHWEENTLRSFDISIGCCEIGLPYGSEISRIPLERRLRFSSNEEISSVKELLRQASSFELVGHSSVKSLTDFDLKNVGALKVCVVKGCTKMVNIVEITEETDCLACLEKLHLVNLEELKTIWKGPVPGRSFANLKDLTLFGCPGLTRILNFSQAKALSSLEYVRVEKCYDVAVIINEEEEGEDTSEGVNRYDLLNKVMTIELVNLRSLHGICMTKSMEWKSLVRIVMTSCNQFRDVDLNLNKAEKMETVAFEVDSHIGEGETQISRPWHEFICRRENKNQLASKVGPGGESSEQGRSADAVESSHGVRTRHFCGMHLCSKGIYQVHQP